MALPTQQQLGEFFGLVTQLRQFYQRVDVIFRGANATPTVIVYWGVAGKAAAIVSVESDGVDDMITALTQLYSASQAEGALRNQIIVAEAQLAALQSQLGSR